MDSYAGQTKRYTSVAVLGSGAWGTALAQVSAHAGLDVQLWGRDKVIAKAILTGRENTKYLPGVSLHSQITPTLDLSECMIAGLILLVTPTQSLRAVCVELKEIVAPQVPIVICAKGIEQGTRKFVTEIVSAILPGNPVAILSGPSFASDVVRGLPTAVTVAGNDPILAEAIANTLGTQNFRLYYSGDVRGVEIGGAAKNVLAIACGIAHGRQLGASAQAALIARGFAELRRFGAAYGANQETLMGLSGLGDLVLTCSSPQSRNFSLGVGLGQGMSLADASGGKLAEGIFTAHVLAEMAAAADVEMPIVAAVNDILIGKLGVREATAGLMMRPQRSEVGDQSC